MRTTLIIPDPLFRRAKQYAKMHNKKMSELFAEAVDERLTREQQSKQARQQTYRVKSWPMGTPKADIADRESLFETMEE